MTRTTLFGVVILGFVASACHLVYTTVRRMPGVWERTGCSIQLAHDHLSAGRQQLQLCDRRRYQQERHRDLEQHLKWIHDDGSTRRAAVVHGLGQR